MPFTTPLREVPALPVDTARLVDENGVPTRDFTAYLAALAAWQRAVQAALKQLEP
jgi:hypothetical protein